MEVGLGGNKINGWSRVPSLRDENAVGEIGQIQDTVKEQDSVVTAATVV